jgi:hypothetical protein
VTSSLVAGGMSPASRTDRAATRRGGPRSPPPSVDRVQLPAFRCLGSGATGINSHQRRVDRDKPHFGLLPFTNDTFPRHRHDAFVGQLLAALEHQLLTHADENDSSWVRWLPKKV